MCVIAIMAVVAAFIAPAFTSLKSAGDVTSAAYTIKGVLDQGRTYAIANNTYTWVGFYEEDASQSSTSPATPGIGRVVLSIVASSDGTKVYSTAVSPATTIDPTKLTQVIKLTKIDGVHLKVFPTGSGTGTTFDTRPAFSAGNSQIGDTEPPNPSLTPIQFPVGNPAPTAQYTFTKALQFAPNGQVRIDNDNYTLKRVLEIGLQPCHGTTPDVNNPNVAAIQIAGVSANVKIFKK